jgi:hypothetical protein
MTAPLVPADVDLRGLPYMPLDVGRLRDSDLAISASGDEFRAAVLLWCASWNQVPAASLPDDDKILATYAGFGRDMKGWKKVKAGALRGFVRCDDGRLYHPVVAEKALEAWDERLEYRDKRDNEAERLRRHREEHQQLRTELRSYGVTAAWNEKIEALRERVQYERQQRGRTEPETRTGALPATAKKGREGKGLVKSEGEEHAGTPEDPQLPEGVDPERWASYRDQLADDGKLSISRIKTALLQLHRVTQAGHDPNAVLTAAVMRGLRDLDDCAARLAREANGQPARAGPRQPAATPGKTVQSLQNLEAMKNGSDMDPQRDSDRLPEARHAQLGSPAGG